MFKAPSMFKSTESKMNEWKKFPRTSLGLAAKKMADF